jgi:hypothetical protein
MVLATDAKLILKRVERFERVEHFPSNVETWHDTMITEKNVPMPFPACQCPTIFTYLAVP